MMRKYSFPQGGFSNGKAEESFLGRWCAHFTKGYSDGDITGIFTAATASNKEYCNDNYG